MSPSFVLPAAAARARAALVVALAAVLLSGPLAAPARSAPLPVRVVVVTTFQHGSDAGSEPGEFRLWVQRFPLPSVLPFPAGYRALRYNRARGVLGIVTGEGAERAAASIMALGLDPRFDLSKAYWVLAGIAGVDPRNASVGSAAWARWIVNADLAFEIDGREIPANWSTGVLPLGRTAPYQMPRSPADSIHGQLAFALNSALAAWAYRLTAHVPLPDDANLRALRAPYPEPAARRPPFVLLGDTLSGDRFWIGSAMNDWAEHWVAYWTAGRGRYVMTAEEDAGVLQSLTFLAHARRIDPARVLVLRTASDYDAPAPHQRVLSLLAADAGTAGESAWQEAIEAAYRVGSPVVAALARGWSAYRAHPPAAPASIASKRITATLR